LVAAAILAAVKGRHPAARPALEVPRSREFDAISAGQDARLYGSQEGRRYSIAINLGRHSVTFPVDAVA